MIHKTHCNRIWLTRVVSKWCSVYMCIALYMQDTTWDLGACGQIWKSGKGDQVEVKSEARAACKEAVSCMSINPAATLPKSPIIIQHAYSYESTISSGRWLMWLCENSKHKFVTSGAVQGKVTLNRCWVTSGACCVVCKCTKCMQHEEIVLWTKLIEYTGGVGCTVTMASLNTGLCITEPVRSVTSEAMLASCMFGPVWQAFL